METLSIRLLGTVELRLGTEPVQGFVSSKAQALFLYLAVTRRPVARTALATLFWGDWPETAARRSLSKVLSNLRHLLGEYLQIERQTVAFCTEHPHWLDVVLFEQATESALQRDLSATALTQVQEGIALYRGDIFAGFQVANAPDFDAWVRIERARLHQRCHAALTALIAHATQGGDLNQAIAWTQDLLHLEPTDEQAHCQLMTLYAQNGQRSQALAQYELCREILAEELDVDPAVETTALYQTIRQGNGTFAPPVDNAPAVRTPTATMSSALFSGMENSSTRPAHMAPNELAFVGRDVRWQQILSDWQQRAFAHPHFCLIRGEAGIGKTRLAEEVLAWGSRRGIAVSRARAYAAAGELAYTPVIDWLRSKPLQQTLSTLDPIWRTELTRLLPELAPNPAQPTTDRGAPTVGNSQWQRQRLFDALARTFRAGSVPKIVLLDDLQWCDRETLAWLHYLLQAQQNGEAQDVAGAPLLIIATARPEILHETHPFQPILLHLRSEERLTEIALDPLDEAETTALANDVTGQALTQAEIAALYAYTEGNPLFIIETLRKSTWQADLANTTTVHPSLAQPSLPAKVQAVIQERLAAMSTAAMRLAGLAAVIGRSFEFGLLEQASREREEPLFDALNELWQYGIILPHGNQRYDFSHDRIREVAYLTVSPVQRPLWHRQVAQALEALYADELEPVSAQLAFHWEAAGEIEQAIGYYRQAAEKAYLVFADGDAVDFLSHALTLVETLPSTVCNKKIELEILLKLKEPLKISRGHFEHTLGVIGMRAIALAEEVGKTSQLAEALHCLFLFHLMRAQYTESRLLAEKIASLIPDRDIEDTNEYQFPLANVLLFLGEFVSAQMYFDKGLSASTISSQPLIFAAMNLWFLGYPEQAQQCVNRAIKIVRCANQPHLIAHLAINRARLHHFMHEINRMGQFTEEALALKGTYDSPIFLILAKLFQGRVLAEKGESAQGTAQIQTMLRQLDEKYHTAFRTHFLSLLAESYACAGQFSNALDILNQALGYVEHNCEGVWHAELVRLRGEYRQASGASLHEVTICYEEAISIAQSHQTKSLELRATMSLARLWQQQGQHAAALARLSAIYGWFTEGFNTADLREAKALLEELSKMSQWDG